MKSLLDKANMLRLMAFRAPTREQARVYHEQAQRIIEQIKRGLSQ